LLSTGTIRASYIVCNNRNLTRRRRRRRSVQK